MIEVPPPDEFDNWLADIKVIDVVRVLTIIGFPFAAALAFWLLWIAVAP